MIQEVPHGKYGGSPTVQSSVTKFGSSGQLNPRIFKINKYVII